MLSIIDVIIAGSSKLPLFALPGKSDKSRGMTFCAAPAGVESFSILKTRWVTGDSDKFVVQLSLAKNGLAKRFFLRFAFPFLGKFSPRIDELRFGRSLLLLNKTAHSNKQVVSEIADFALVVFFELRNLPRRDFDTNFGKGRPEH